MRLIFRILSEANKLASAEAFRLLQEQLDGRLTELDQIKAENSKLKLASEPESASTSVTELQQQINQLQTTIDDQKNMLSQREIRIQELNDGNNILY